jgi:hypothetical protein
MADYLNGPRSWFTTNAVSNAGAADFTISSGFRPNLLYISNTGANPANLSFRTAAVITSGSETVRLLAGKDYVIPCNPAGGDGVPGVDMKVSMISETGATTVVITAVGKV